MNHQALKIVDLRVVDAIVRCLRKICIELQQRSDIDFNNGNGQSKSKAKKHKEEGEQLLELNQKNTQFSNIVIVYH